jgi:glycosyltransferase involved in cell wall biosynthesis
MSRGFCEWAFGGRRNTPDRMIFISRGSQEACREGVSGIVQEDRWVLLPNGLDLEHYQVDDQRRRRFRQEHGLSNEVAVGVACAIRPRKQLEHLFEAAARLSDLPIRVIVAGGPVPGDEEYCAALIDEGRHRLGGRFTFLGYLNDLRDLLNGLDVFVNTSREEACSISVLESLACGCPVLGYPSKSVDEQVLPGGGEIVPQDNLDRLSATMREWAEDTQALARRRPAARHRAEQGFDISKLASQLWTEYRAVIDQRS